MTYTDKTPVYTRTEVGIPPGGGSKLNHPLRHPTAKPAFFC